ncbi:MAG: SMI1/KNR4 family protein, partial [Streptococcaceae bacterium]|nr:SMI1/KNR4 family protein [Streptococcaceae bacterium]
MAMKKIFFIKVVLIFSFLFNFVFTSYASAGRVIFSEKIEIPKYTNEQLLHFEEEVLSKYGLRIPPFLSDTYLTGKNFLEKGFTSSDIDAEFDFYALLTEKESNDKISIEAILKVNSETGIVSPTRTALPFGIDACGNLFYADVNAKNEPVVWFHDH